MAGVRRDHGGILTSFIVPLVCYLYIAYYGSGPLCGLETVTSR